jgi:hypothetical protein
MNEKISAPNSIAQGEKLGGEHIQVIYRPDLSLNQITNLHSSGTSVVRSPHIGSQYPSNLALAAQNVPYVIFDRNVSHNGLEKTNPRQDWNYHPNYIIQDGSVQEPKMYPEDILSLSANISTPNSIYKKGDYIEQYLKNLSNLFPSTEIRTLTQDMNQHSDILEKVCKISLEIYPEIWNKYVESGKYKTAEAPKNDLDLLGLGDKSNGYHLPLEVTIVFQTIIETLKQRTDLSSIEQIFHLAGPDMKNYMKDKNFIAKINEMYTRFLSQESGYKLPETVAFNLVPSSLLKFVVPKEKKAQLDELITLIQKMEFNKSQRDEFFREASKNDNVSSEEKGKQIKYFKGRQVELEEQIKIILPGIKKYICYDIKQMNFFSQYDMQSSDDLYIPEWLKENPLSEIEKVYKYISGLKLDK